VEPPDLDAYATLGVDERASAEEIRRAYRRLARALHPDANPGDAAAAERFRRVARAYGVLGDPLRRLRYDRARGGAGPRAARYGPPPSGNTVVRGPRAHPAHRSRPAAPPTPRRDRDEWRFLAGVARWAAVAVVSTLLALAIVAAVLSAEGPRSPVDDPVGSPGGTGFCRTVDGWVACRLVEVRGG
jgi:hypothetical protein